MTIQPEPYRDGLDDRRAEGDVGPHSPGTALASSRPGADAVSGSLVEVQLVLADSCPGTCWKHPQPAHRQVEDRVALLKSSAGMAQAVSAPAQESKPSGGARTQKVATSASPLSHAVGSAWLRRRGRPGTRSRDGSASLLVHDVGLALPWHFKPD
jgi:hypothetical protein